MLTHKKPHLVPILARHLSKFHLQAVVCCVQLGLLLSHLQRGWQSHSPTLTSLEQLLCTVLDQLLAALVQNWINPISP